MNIYIYIYVYSIYYIQYISIYIYIYCSSMVASVSVSAVLINLSLSICIYIYIYIMRVCLCVSASLRLCLSLSLSLAVSLSLSLSLSVPVCRHARLVCRTFHWLFKLSSRPQAEHQLPPHWWYRGSNRPTDQMGLPFVNMRFDREHDTAGGIRLAHFAPFHSRQHRGRLAALRTSTASWPSPTPEAVALVLRESENRHPRKLLPAGSIALPKTRLIP